MDRFQRLRQAIFDKSLSKATLFMRAGAIASPDQATEALNLAASVGYFPVFKEIANAFASDLEAETIDWAVSAISTNGSPSPEILKYLLESLHVTRFDLSRSLCYAATSGSLECVRLLVLYGADVNFVNEISRTTPAENAVRNFHQSVLRELLSNGCQVQLITVFEDVSKTDTELIQEMTLLEFACYIENHDAVSLLRKYK
ncbi:ankyrin repeat domain-containing protein [Stieleria sp. JC731]|uniref:ankyrin repeat domain-containing protein n=1 Tax=Pirellulaceae TaxID=2691357 RepID=UPI001E5E0C1C|nr:ankyrin repeat domain-containing protein [Stieleria sp. JC731]MCC9603193.1 ankyrin repeat domain-containing protein [Stieleria sp. JC731]